MTIVIIIIFLPVLLLLLLLLLMYVIMVALSQYMLQDHLTVSSHNHKLAYTTSTLSSVNWLHTA